MRRHTNLQNFAASSDAQEKKGNKEITAVSEETLPNDPSLPSSPPQHTPSSSSSSSAPVSSSSSSSSTGHHPPNTKTIVSTVQISKASDASQLLDSKSYLDLMNLEQEQELIRKLHTTIVKPSSSSLNTSTGGGGGNVSTSSGHHPLVRSRGVSHDLVPGIPSTPPLRSFYPPHYSNSSSSSSSSSSFPQSSNNHHHDPSHGQTEHLHVRASPPSYSLGTNNYPNNNNNNDYPYYHPTSASGGDNYKPSAVSNDQPHQINHPHSSNGTIISSPQPVPNLFEVALPLIRQGYIATIDDSFTRCFKSKKTVYWNWNTYLFPAWVIGLIFRYVLVLPLRIVFLLLAFILGILAFIFVKCLGIFGNMKKWEIFIIQNIATAFVTSWSGVIRIHGMRPKPKPNQPVGVYVANHSSMIDFIVLLQSHPYAVVGQHHKGWVGFLQDHLLNSLNCLWFDRGAVKDKKIASDKIRAHTKDPKNSSCPLLIFPEGTCVNNEYVVQFKKNVFEIGVPINPIAIKYSKIFVDAYWNSREESFHGHLFRLMSSWAVVCDIWFLDPQTQRPGEDGAAFAARVQKMIAQRAGLKAVPWDGYMKYWKPSDRFIQARQERVADDLCDLMMINNKALTPIVNHSPPAPSSSGNLLLLPTVPGQGSVSEATNTTASHGNSTTFVSNVTTMDNVSNRTHHGNNGTVAATDESITSASSATAVSSRSNESIDQGYTGSIRSIPNNEVSALSSESTKANTNRSTQQRGTPTPPPPPPTLVPTPGRASSLSISSSTKGREHYDPVTEARLAAERANNREISFRTDTEEEVEAELLVHAAATHLYFQQQQQRLMNSRSTSSQSNSSSVNTSFVLDDHHNQLSTPSVHNLTQPTSVSSGANSVGPLSVSSSAVVTPARTSLVIENNSTNMNNNLSKESVKHSVLRSSVGSIGSTSSSGSNSTGHLQSNRRSPRAVPVMTASSYSATGVSNTTVTNNKLLNNIPALSSTTRPSPVATTSIPEDRSTFEIGESGDSGGESNDSQIDEQRNSETENIYIPRNGSIISSSGSTSLKSTPGFGASSNPPFFPNNPTPQNQRTPSGSVTPLLSTESSAANSIIINPVTSNSTPSSHGSTQSTNNQQQQMPSLMTSSFVDMTTNNHALPPRTSPTTNTPWINNNNIAISSTNRVIVQGRGNASTNASVTTAPSATTPNTRYHASSSDRI